MDARRRNIASGAPWEPIVGYSRAVRVGPLVFVAGTAAADASGQVVGKGDPYAQAAHILGKVRAALEQAGARIEDVVRTRLYVTDADFWEPVGRAHKEFFGDTMPVCTLVEVRGFLDPDMLVEIEVDAVIGERLP
jgi:enamine deaminase RidA (YjgF/YER057c/UK114 family)